MFDRPHHRRVAEVLSAIDVDLMVRQRCLFGGGTAIVLSHGEYRESVDIDFICSSIEGYRSLRGTVNSQGFQALLTRPFTMPREARIDQYGIRAALLVDATPVKFEIVFEGRIELSPPLESQRICQVWTLADEDRVATKLMANSDRWADDSVLSRDLIDLAMLCADGRIGSAGVAKALRAYGPSVLADFQKARDRLLHREDRLAKCMKGMGMTMRESDLRARITALTIEVPADVADESAESGPAGASPAAGHKAPRR
ncbi:MAG: nucleotidyl transferase AbiEii/AbiGii toxin family protein [Paucibacter sp.]|nr:nucleotidyl transferase AbiEii/AbiGii toxin family protein [Roseateles sp.]